MNTRGFRRLAAAWVLLGLGASAPAGRVLLVCNAGSGCPSGFAVDGNVMFADLNAAANHAQDGDTILIWPGVYHSQAKIRANDVVVRGMDRYGVVLDGSGRTLGIGLTGGDDAGLTTYRNVSFENMSGREYRSQPFFLVNLRGYSARYLTGYNTDSYGIYAFQSTGDANAPSSISLSYASGNADSGFYIGGCQPCNAVIDRVWSEHNALGYSGTNAGGNLTLENSEWNGNVTGILPNTLPSEPDSPQRGAVIRNNLVHDNNNATAPGTGLTGLAPLGVGIGVAGGWDNQIFGNDVFGHKHFGIALFWLETPPIGNKVFSNTLAANLEADLADIGPGSVNNCFSDNVDRVLGEPTSEPPMIQTLNSCANPVQAAEFPNPTFVTNVAGITEPRNPGPQPDPPTPLDHARVNTDLRRAAVACMPNPCAGIGVNAFCSGGSPVAGARSAECAASGT